jgi:hypothetical protein
MLLFILSLLKMFMKQSIRSINQRQVVKVYIVTESHSCMFGIETLNIHTIPLHQQAVFLKQYAGRVLIEANSVGEVLLKFSKWLNE